MYPNADWLSLPVGLLARRRVGTVDPMGELACQIEYRDDVSVATVRGELRLDTTRQLRDSLHKCLAQCPSALVVDLAEVTVDSDLPLTVLRAVHSQARHWPGVPMLLCGPTPDMTERLARTGIGRHMTVHDSVAQALAAVDRTSPAPGAVRAGLPVTAEAGAEARSLVRQACQVWRLEDLTEPAEVIVSELASNAVRHGQAPLSLLIAVRGAYLHLAVYDAGPYSPHLDAASDRVPDLATGRGLYLVAALAVSWGSLASAGGKTVWATLRIRPDDRVSRLRRPAP